MRFCIISTQYLPTAGGVERYSFNIAKRLTALGHEVCVVCSALPNLPARETDAYGIEIFRMPSHLLMQGRFPVIKRDAAFKALEEEFWAKPFDFCLINTYFYPLSIYAARKTAKLKIKSIVVNHGSAWLMTGNPVLSLAGKIYEQLAARVVKHACKSFYGVSQACCDWLRHFGITAKGILSNAVDIDELKALAQSSDVNWRESIGVEPNAPLIAFVGRLIPEKGVVSIENAMPAIREVIPDACVVLAGTGPLLDDIRAKNIPGLYAVGKQSYADTLALLTQADAFCLPTRSEGFACTVLESAALSCPIITTATGGSPQLLLDETYGTLMKDMSAEQTAQACIAALSDANWRKTAAEKAFNKLVASFTWDKTIEMLLSISEGDNT